MEASEKRATNFKIVKGLVGSHYYSPFLRAVSAPPFTIRVILNLYLVHQYLKVTNQLFLQDSMLRLQNEDDLRMNEDLTISVNRSILSL